MQSTPNPTLERLGALVGRWDTRMFQAGQQVGQAETTFEWVEDGAFVVQRAYVPVTVAEVSGEWMKHAPFPVVAYIGLDDQGDTFTMLYADARRVYRVYQMSVDGNVWRASRAAPGFHQRFEGTISRDGKTIEAHWDGSEDGTAWQRDFDMTYTKID